MIKSIKKLTNFRWLNLFDITYKNKDGNDAKWMMTSRKQDPTVGKDKPDAVVIIPILDDRMVLIKQYRPPLGDYIIEHPAGLIDKGETPLEAAARELKEEVGLDIIESFASKKITYNSPGITDESVVYVFAKTKGEPHTDGNESLEDIEVLVVDPFEAKELLNSDVLFSAKCWLIVSFFAAGNSKYDDIIGTKK